METAVKVLVANPMRQNRMLTGPQAHELGLADRLFDPAEFLDESIALALTLTRRTVTVTVTVTVRRK